MEKVSIFGVEILNTTLDEVTLMMDKHLKKENPGLKVIFTPNTEIVMDAKKDVKLKNLVNSADLVIADGIGLIYGSKIQKKPLKERVTGFDTSIKMLELANEFGYSIYLLGGKEGVSEEAAKNIRKDYPNVKIAGNHHGYFSGSHTGETDSKEELKIIDDINTSKPDIIFVGFGFPRQEIWIDANRDRISAKLIIGNGGVMDILSGNAERAPQKWQDLGLEWLYRLIKNPSRIKRQMVLPIFMLHMIFNKEAVK